MNIKRLFIHCLIVSAITSTDLSAGKTAPQPAKVLMRPKGAKKTVIKQTTLTVSCNIAGATVTQDGIILGNAGNSFEVDPGALMIDVAAPGYQTKRVKIIAKTNVANSISVVLIKALPTRKPTAIARPTTSIKGRPQIKNPTANVKKPAPTKRKPDLFGDDFAGTDAGPPPQAAAPQSSPKQRQVRPSAPQPAPRQAQQPAPAYQPGYSAGPQQGFTQPSFQQPYPPAPSYPQYPQYQGASPGYNPSYTPGYNPGYPPPGYPAPGYQAPGYGAPIYQNPSPYYYYPQQQYAPAPMAVPMAPPVEAMAAPSIGEAPLPSVAEAPAQSGPPPAEELVPRVGRAKKTSASAQNPLIKFLPFGAGQYQNKNYILGGAFTAAQGGALVLYFMNSSSSAKAQTNFAQAIANRDAVTDSTSADYSFYDQQANEQATYGKKSDQNATLCLIGFFATWATSTIEAAIDAPSASGKGHKKTRGRRRGLAFETGMGEEGLEAQVTYSF